MAMDDRMNAQRKILVLVLSAQMVGCGGDDSADIDVTAETGVDSAPAVDGGDAQTQDVIQDDALEQDAVDQDVRNQDADAGPPFDPEALPKTPLVFVDGIQVGGTTENSAIFWTRIAQSTPVRLVVWQPMSDGTLQVAGDVAVQPDDLGFVHHELTGLTPWTVYNWGFFVEDDVGTLVERSAIGRLKTAPEHDALPTIVFAGTHGTHYSHLPLDTLAANADYDLDFFVHLGDSSYNDDAEILNEFHERYAYMWQDRGFRTIFTHTTFYPVWDDHELYNNWDPETVDPARRDAAFQAYFDYNAVPRFANQPNRIWTKFRWGKTAELFLLDSRSERRPSTRKSANAEYISPAQLAWLQDELLASDAVFKLIANSVPITNFPSLFDLAADDRWEGYAAQREKLLNFIVDNDIHGVVWLSGDFHIGSLERIETGGVWSSMIEILMGPGGSNRNPVPTPLLPGEQHGFYFARNDDMVTVVELNPNIPNMRVDFFDKHGDLYISRNFPGGEAP